MSALTSEVIDRAIRYARKLSTTDRYDWPTARAALARILADLEARDPTDPALDRLRRFIAEGDRTGSVPRTRGRRDSQPES
jgi:TilS substrate binding domain